MNTNFIQIITYVVSVVIVSFLVLTFTSLDKAQADNGKKILPSLISAQGPDDQMKVAIQNATQDELGKMQEMLQIWASTILSKK